MGALGCDSLLRFVALGPLQGFFSEAVSIGSLSIEAVAIREGDFHSWFLLLLMRNFFREMRAVGCAAHERSQIWCPYPIFDFYWVF